MPIWLRNFTFKNIEDYNKRIAEQQKKAKPSTKPALGPNIQPSFTSKSSKK